ncbi:glycosyltransferase family 2 protein [Winogradskyella sp. PE311]|uniref:glycosyltransferase family 2 protein n=1 Tax=Winogradskyella sp. PE311 TaxID=3366943 RepID=UPI00398152D4
MKLSVVILNYNVRYFLELSLKSVEAAIKTIDAEIIVVDNNSSDGSCEMVKELFPSVKLIVNKENSGFSKGNNIGVAEANGEYLCILNPDTVVAEDTFAKLLSYAKSKNDLGIIGCQLIDGKGQFLPESKRNIPKPKVALKKLLGRSHDYYANQIQIEETGRVEILVGAFMLLKKAVYNAVGGFDEDYFMYGEDIDLSYKILKAGYHNYYFGETTIIHFKGESTLRDANYAKRFYGAMQIFYKKHFKRNLLFNGLVWLGIKMAYSIRTFPANVNIKLNNIYIYSEVVNSSLSKVFKEPVNELTSLSNEIKNDSMLIYDFNYLSITNVIDDIKQKSKQENIVIRFIPKNSNFIIGSDSAINRGEIVKF